MTEAWLSDRDWIRLEIYKEKAVIAGFLISYEAEIGGKRYAIVRYDTVHGFAHKDTMRPDGSQAKERMPDLDYASLAALAYRDIARNWRDYRKRFEGRLHGEKGDNNTCTGL